MALASLPGLAVVLPKFAGRLRMYWACLPHSSLPKRPHFALLRTHSRHVRFLKRAVLDILGSAGYEVVRRDRSTAAMLLRSRAINVILDVGANTGQYAFAVRKLGYGGRIVSFEPLRAAFTRLSKRARGDDRWSVANFALGDFDGHAQLNVSRSTEYSSLLAGLPQLSLEHPGAAYVGREDVAIHRLDSVFDRYCRGGEAVLLKIDTQGYERRVLDGARASLDRIAGVQLELSNVPLYDGEPLIVEMIDYMAQAGFTLLALSPIPEDLARGQLLRADGMFFRLAPAR